MTPQEKAKELVEKFSSHSKRCVNDLVVSEYDKINGEKCKKTLTQLLNFSAGLYAKQCALIAVDEIIGTSSNQVIHRGRNGLDDLSYWQQVKEEIEKL